MNPPPLSNEASSISAKWTSQLIELPSRDGKAKLRGQLDVPKINESGPLPVVVIVNGGWFMERDGHLGNSGTERDLVYRDLAHAILGVGVAVARYDNRGVRCNEMTMPPCPAGSSEVEISRHYLECCVEADVRQTVTVRTQLDDVEDLWNFVRGHPRLNANAMVLLAHSEGGLNAARLIGQGRISPLGVIMFGAGTGSPADSLRWQMVDNRVARLMSWDDDRDGIVTPQDVDRHLPGDPVFLPMESAVESLKPPSGGWTRAAAHEHFSKLLGDLKAATLSKPDDAPYPDQWGELRMIAASNQWFRQWFEDSTRMVDHLSAYDGSLSLHIGSIDSQFAGEEQFRIARDWIKAGRFKRQPHLLLHHGLGHSLRSGEPSAGPMDAGVRDSIVEEIQAMLPHQ